MADTTTLSNNLRKAQFAFDAIDSEFSGQWGPESALKRYEPGTPQYIAALKQYKKLKPQHEAAKKALEAAQTAYEKVASEKKATDSRGKEVDAIKRQENAAKMELQRARDLNDTAAIAAAQKKIEDARSALVTLNQKPIDSGNKTPEPEPGKEPGNLYADYTLGSDGSVTNKDGIDSYFIGDPDDKGEIAQTPYTSLAKARDGFMAKYSQPGQIAELQKQLLASGYIKESQIKDRTWIQGVDELIKEYTFQSVSDIKYGGVKEPKGLTDFLKVKKASSAGASKTYRVITTRSEAKKMLDEYYTDLMGRNATPEETDTFYNQLHTAENKATQVNVGGTQTGSVLQDADRLMIAANVAKKSLRGSDVDEILKAKTGSQAAIDIADLQREAAAYGIDMPAAEALKRVAAGVGQKEYLAKQKERLRQLSMTVHPYLKDHIAAGGTVKDVADVYAYAKSTKLGVPVPTSTQDKDVMAALAAGKTTTDFERELQSNPLWRRTEEARTKADDFVNTMLKTFGLVG